MKRRLGLLAIVMWGVMASSAYANTREGSAEIDSNGTRTIRGTHATISTPNTTPSNYNVLAGTYGMVGLDDSFDITDTLRTGYIQLNSFTLDQGCTSDPGHVKAFTLYDLSTGQSGCNIADGSIGGSGQETHKFGIRRNTDGTNWWSEFYNGTEKLVLNAGFSYANYTLAYGDLSGTASPLCNTNTSIWGRFTTDTPWEWTDDVYPNTSTWHTITGATISEDTGWNVTGSASPITASFSC